MHQEAVMETKDLIRKYQDKKVGNRREEVKLGEMTNLSVTKN